MGLTFDGSSIKFSDETIQNTAFSSGLLPTISNSGDNRIFTSDGTSTGINAEDNLTFDGNTLSVSGTLDVNGSGIYINSAPVIKSDTAEIPGSSGVFNMVQISQASYDALVAVDPNTVYFIV